MIASHPLRQLDKWKGILQVTMATLPWTTTPKDWAFMK